MIFEWVVADFPAKSLIRFLPNDDFTFNQGLFAPMLANALVDEAAGGKWPREIESVTERETNNVASRLNVRNAGNFTGKLSHHNRIGTELCLFGVRRFSGMRQSLQVEMHR